MLRRLALLGAKAHSRVSHTCHIDAVVRQFSAITSIAATRSNPPFPNYFLHQPASYSCIYEVQNGLASDVWRRNFATDEDRHSGPQRPNGSLIDPPEYDSEEEEMENTIEEGYQVIAGWMFEKLNDYEREYLEERTQDRLAEFHVKQTENVPIEKYTEMYREYWYIEEAKSRESRRDRAEDCRIELLQELDRRIQEIDPENPSEDLLLSDDEDDDLEDEFYEITEKQLMTALYMAKVMQQMNVIGEEVPLDAFLDMDTALDRIDVTCSADEIDLDSIDRGFEDYPEPDTFIVDEDLKPKKK